MLVTLSVLFSFTSAHYGHYYLPGLENYNPSDTLYLQDDFPGQNGVPTQFAYQKKSVEVEVDHKWVTIAYVECGETLVDARPVLFLHGQPTWSYLWRNILPFVCAQAHGIAIDLPGYGLSDKDFPDWDFDFGISALEAFIQALQLQNIVLVNHDWGGPHGFGYANRNPSNVAGIVLFETIIEEYPPFGQLTDFENAFFASVTATTFGDAVTQALIRDLFFVQQVNDVFLLFPNDELLTAYLHPFSFGTLLDRFVQFLLPQCLPFPDLVGSGNSLFGECREDVVNIINNFEPFFINSNIPKLAFIVSPGTTFSSLLQQIIDTYDVQNVTVSNIGPSIHYVQEDATHRLGALISKWLDVTGLAPLEF